MTFFGDIGGFSGFLMTLLGLLVGPTPSKLFNMSTTKRLFSTVITNESNNINNLKQLQPKLSSIKYDKITVLRYIFGCLRQKSRHKRILDKGRAKIERILDIQSIMRHQGALMTIQRLLLSKSERKLIGMQRRTRAIDLSMKDSSSEGSAGLEATKLLEF